jgi:predicted secreted protein
MPTLGTVEGNKIGIYIEDVLIACATSATIDFTTNLVDSTCKDNNGAEQVLPGQKSWSMGLDANLAFDATYGWVDLVDAWNTGTLLNVKWGTEETGDESYSGEAYIDSLSASAPLNEVTTYSVNFRGTGDITIAPNA